MIKVWCKFEQNRTKAIKSYRAKALNVVGMTEFRSHGITDMLKTVYPAKTMFCGGGGGGGRGDGINIFKPPVVYAADRSKAVVPVLFLFYVALWFILWAASCFKIFPCSLSSCFFIPFSIVITSLGEEGAGLCASRAFVFVYVFFFFFFFPLVSDVGCGLWLLHSLNFSIIFCELWNTHVHWR